MLILKSYTENVTCQTMHLSHQEEKTSGTQGMSLITDKLCYTLEYLYGRVILVKSFTVGKGLGIFKWSPLHEMCA